MSYKFNPFTSNFDYYDTGENFTDITYEDFVTAIGSSSLTEGMIYRITDFKTDYVIPNTSQQFAALHGVTEVLRVTATGVNTYNPVVVGENYPEDIITWTHENLWGNYSGGSTGHIYFREDPTRQIRFGFDFRVVKYRRWEKVEGSGLYDSYQDTELGYQDVLHITYINNPEYQVCNNINMAGCYTTTNNVFGEGDIKNIEASSANFKDNTVIMGGFSDMQFSSHAMGNIFYGSGTEGNYFNLVAGDNFNYNVFSGDIINFNVGQGFEYNEIDEITNTVMGSNCSYNEGNTILDCKIGNGFYNNTFNQQFNTISHCDIGNDFAQNNINTIFDANIIGHSFGVNGTNDINCDQFNNNVILAPFYLNTFTAGSGKYFAKNVCLQRVEYCTFNGTFEGNMFLAQTYDCTFSNVVMSYNKIMSDIETVVITNAEFVVTIQGCTFMKSMYTVTWNLSALSQECTISGCTFAQVSLPAIPDVSIYSNKEFFSTTSGHDHDGVNSKTLTYLDLITSVPYELNVIEGVVTPCVEGGSSSTVAGYTLDGGSS